MKRQCLALSVNWLDLPFEIWAQIIPLTANQNVKLACLELYNYVCSTSTHMHIQRYVSKQHLSDALMRRPRVTSLYLRSGINLQALKVVPRHWKKVNIEYYGQMYPTLVCKHLHLRYPSYINVRSCEQVTMHGMWPYFSHLYAQTPNINLGMSWVPSLFRVALPETLAKVNILDLRLEYRVAFNGSVTIEVPTITPRIVLPNLAKIKLNNWRQFDIFKGLDCSCVAPVVKIYACFYYARGRTIETIWESFLRPAIAMVPATWSIKIQLEYAGDKIIYIR